MFTPLIKVFLILSLIKAAPKTKTLENIAIMNYKIFIEIYKFQRCQAFW